VLHRPPGASDAGERLRPARPMLESGSARHVRVEWAL
jgi:hypothetical protein